MKKLLAALFVLAMVVGLAACGSMGDGRYDAAPREYIRAARQALEIADDFLDGNMESSEATTALREIQDEIRAMADAEDIVRDGEVDSAALATVFIDGDIDMLIMTLITYGARSAIHERVPTEPAPTTDGVLELRNQIAESLGARLR